MTKAKPGEHYHMLDYYSPERLGQYYHQIKTVKKTAPKTILEIGVGPGVITHILRQAGYEVTTCDLDPSLKPDLVADLMNLPLQDNAMDMILCCQVLEHLPLSSLHHALIELKRVCRRAVLISVPYAGHAFFNLHKYPGGHKRFWVVHWPRWFKKPPMDAEHHWELGQPGCSRKQLAAIIKKTGLKLEEAFAPIESPNNYFMLLKKDCQP